MKTIRYLLLALMLGGPAVGCGKKDSPPPPAADGGPRADGGPAADGGPLADGGEVDAGPAADGGPVDAGPPDAGTVSFSAYVKDLITNQTLGTNEPQDWTTITFTDTESETEFDDVFP